MDGKTWTTVKNVTKMEKVEKQFHLHRLKHKICKTAGCREPYHTVYSLWEMTVYGIASGSSDTSVPSGTNVAKAATATASGSESDAMAAKYAVDGDNGTRWSSNFADYA